MKKKVMIMMLAVMLLAVSAAFANPVIYLAGDAWVEVNPVKDAVQFIWKFSDSGDMWPDNQVMYCPDPLRGGCDQNIPFAPVVSGKNYQFNVPMMVIAGGQSGFSLAKDGNWSDNLWLGLPDCSKLHLGRNLIYYNSTPDSNIPNSGGMHILYVGPGAPFVPKADDPRIYNCAAEPVKSVTMSTAPQKRSACAPNAGACDDNVSVKGNDNDVTSQKVKNQGKIGKTVIKGNNNTVKKNLTNIGIAAKTTGNNSPITVHINGVPLVADETCIKCHTNVVKKTTTDKNGNIVTEQKIEQKKEVKK